MRHRKISLFVLIVATLPLRGQQTVISTPPTLPQALVDVSTLPKVTGTTRIATSCSDIQNELNLAAAGDEVVIPASFRCTGASAVNLSLPHHPGSGYVWVHTDQLASLPSLGGRVSLQHAGLMPTLTGATGAFINTEVLGFPSSNAATTLNGAITATSPANGGSLTVTSTTGFASPGNLIVTPGLTSTAELISYTGTTAMTFTGITRCAGGNACGGIPGPGKAHAHLDAVVGSSVAQNPSAYWWITGLSINSPATNYGGSILQIGDTTAGKTHSDIRDIPHHIIFDRLLILGNPAFSTSRGIAAEGANVALIGSYMDDIHAVGLETHGWLTTNGPGPFLLQNNELHALSNTIFFGGSDPSIVGLVPSDIVIRGNWMQNRPSWDAATWTPAYGPGWTTAATGGSIPCTTNVTAELTYVNVTSGVQGESLPGPTSSVTTPTTGCSASATVTPAPPYRVGDPVTGVMTGYKVYACQGASCSSPPTNFWLQGGVNTSFTRAGVTLTRIATNTQAPPSTASMNKLYNGQHWSFKNLTEIKNGQRLLVENNVVENAWPDAQCGDWIVINTASAGAANETGNVTVRYNAMIGQGTAGDFGGITGPQYSGELGTHDVSWTNNVAYNTYGINGCTYEVFTGNMPNVNNDNYQHNTVHMLGQPPFRLGSVWYSESTSSAGIPPIGKQAIHNNIFDIGNTLGISGKCTEGGSAVDCFSNGGAYAGTESFYRNICYNFSGSCTGWQTDIGQDWEKHSCNESSAPWNANVANIARVGFVDVGAFDFRLSQSSSFVGAGTDGLDPGADFVGLTRHLAGVSPSLPPKWGKIASAQASNVGQTSAILKWVNFSTSGPADVCEYGTTTSYGTSCTVTRVGDQDSAIITGLSASRTYFWRVGGTTGMWGSFTTTAAPPADRTLALRATINAEQRGRTRSITDRRRRMVQP